MIKLEIPRDLVGCILWDSEGRLEIKQEVTETEAERIIKAHPTIKIIKQKAKKEVE
jgi:hypothetical protein